MHAAQPVTPKVQLLSLIAVLLLGLAACSDDAPSAADLGSDPAVDVRDEADAGPNQAPTADAGENQSVELGGSATLDGSGSSDPDGDTLTFVWRVIDSPAGSGAAVGNATSVTASLRPDLAGEYVVELIVSDGTTTSDPDSVTITASEPNRAPTADAGPDLSATVGVAVTLDGSGSSDPDGDELTYQWTIADGPEGAAAALSDETVAQPTLTPDEPGTYAIDLVVSDGELESTADRVLVTATTALVNNPPSADAGDDQSVLTGDLVTLDGSGSLDPDGDDISFTWELITLPTGSSASLSGADTDTATFTPDVEGVYEAELTVSDGDLSDTDTVSISASQFGLAPTADAGADVVVPLGASVTLDGSGSSDPEGASLSYSWNLDSTPDGSTAMLVDGTTLTPSLTPDLTGNYVVSLVVNDGGQDSAADTVTVTATGDTCLVISEVIEGSSFNKAVELWNCGSDALPLDGVSLCAVANDDTTCTNTEPLTGSLPAGGVLGLCESRLADGLVDDGDCDIESTATAFNGNDRLLLFVNGDLDDNYDPAEDLLIDAFGDPAVNPGESPRPWEDVTLRRCNIEPYLADVPFVVDDYYNLFELDAFDDFGEAPTDLVCLGSANESPVADAGEDFSADVDTLVEITGTGTDADGTVEAFAWTIEPPEGVSAPALTGADTSTVSFTPVDTGDYILTLTVTDDDDATGEDTVTVTVVEAAAPPVAVAGEDGTVVVGDTVNLDGSGSFDPNGTPIDSYAWTLTPPEDSSASLVTTDTETTSFVTDVAGDYVVSLVVTSDGLTSDPVIITIAATAPPCILISEVIEGSGNNKAVEVWNCGDTELDVSGYAICLANQNDTIDCDASNYSLTGTLAGGAVLSLCNSSADTALRDLCDATSGVANFNGDDRLLLYADTNDNGSFEEETDTRVDAFGQTFTVPGDRIWENTTYRRCNTESYDGIAAFDVADYFNAFAQDAFEDVGTAPTNFICDGTLNSPPTAAAGDDVEADVNSIVTLVGSGTDTDGTVEAYAWTIEPPEGVSAPVLTGANTATVQFMPVELGSYVLTLTVTDDDGATGEDSVTVTVVPVEQLPIADAGDDANGVVDTVINLDGSGSFDPDGTTIDGYTWAITNAPVASTAALANTDQVTTSFTPDEPGSYTVSLTVTSNGDSSAADTVTFTVVDLDETCFVLSEYLEGSSNNKAVELFNCGTGALDMTPFNVCSFNGADATCTNLLELSGNLPLGGVYAVCNSGLADDKDDNCDTTSSITFFNGNDRLAIYLDLGGDAEYQAGTDLLVDAFGDPATQPGEIWTDVTYRRCDLTPYVGAAPFEPLDFYNSYDADDFTDLGIAPSEDSCLGVPNTAPTANAGPDQAAAEAGRLVTLDGSASTDTETPDSLTYSWAIVSQPGGSDISLSDDTAEMPTFTPLVTGDYTFELTVSDGSLSDTDTVTVTVVDTINDPPIANAGDDASVQLPGSVVLDGTGSSDPEGAGLSYAWSITDAPAASTTADFDDDTLAMPTFTPDVPGVYTIQLIANDGVQPSAPDTVLVTATEPPCLLISEVVEGSSNNKAVELWNCGTADLDLSEYSVCLAASTVTECTTSNFNPTGTLAGGEVLAFCNTSADVGLATLCDTTSGVANFNGDDRLLVYLDADDNGSFDEGTDTRIDAFGQTGVIPDSRLWENTTYRRCNDTAYDGVGAFDVYTYFNELPIDTFGDVGTAPTNFTCDGPPNSPPTANAGVDFEADVDSTVTIMGTGTDDDGTIESYAWTIEPPLGVSAPVLTGANTATVQFMPVELGSYVLTLTVTDDDGATGEDSVTVTVVPVEQLPIADAGDDANGVVDTVINLDGSGSFDPDGTNIDGYTWELTDTPVASTAALANTDQVTTSFTPDEPGSYTVSLTVTSNGDSSAADTVTFTVVDLDETCFVLSEYLEGSSNNKAVELFNCGTGALDMTPFNVCSFNGADATCTNLLELSGNLPLGGVYAVCNSGLADDKDDNCDTTSSITFFNGNDRLGIYLDLGGDAEYQAGTDLLIDAFGDPATQPGEIWTDVTYRRCDLTPYVGAAPFEPLDFYNSYDADDFTDLGIAPSEDSCLGVPNTAPTANAGPDQAAAEAGRLVTLDGSASTDTETPDSLTYSWAIVSQPGGSDISLSDDTAEMPTFTPLVTGDYTFELTVSDGSLSDTDTVTVTVVDTINDPPIANAGDDASVQLPGSVVLDGTGSSDPEGAGLSYAWSITDAPAASTTADFDDDTLAMPTFTPDVPGVYTIQLIANDGVQPSAPDTVLVTATEPPCLLISEVVEGSSNNKAVELWNCGTADLDLSEYSVCLAASTVTECTTSNFNPTGTLAGGEVLAFCNTSADVGLATLCDTTSGVANFNGDDRLLVYLDADDNGSFDEGTDTRIDAFGQTGVIPDSRLWENTTYRRCNDTAYDGVGAFDVYTYFNELPIDTFGDVGTAPTNFTCDGPPNSPPTANAGVDFEADVDSTVTIMGTGTDDDGTIESYAWTIEPPLGVSAPVLTGANTATVQFMPVELGSYVLTLTVTDDDGATGEDSVTVTVVPVEQLPIADAGDDANGVVDTVINLDGSGSFDPDGTNIDGYTWELTDTPVASTAALANTDQVTTSFTPDEPGSYTVSLTVTSNGDSSAADTVTFTVVDLDETCFVLSEYLEGSSNNKAVELFNCGTGALDMTPFNVCSFNGADATCTNLLELSGNLPLGGVYAVCNSGLADDKDDNCDTTSSITFFNGNDRLGIYLDLGGDAEYQAGTDLLIDAFGDPATQPGEIWTDVTYRRCDLTPYVGAVPFEPFDFYNSYDADDFTDLGIAPSEDSCLGVPNTAPTANAGPDQADVEAGRTATLDASASTDAETPGALTYLWTIVSQPANSDVSLSDDTAVMPTFTPLWVGSYEFQVEVSDGELSDTDNVVIAVVDTIDDPPIAIAGDDVTVELGTVVTLDGSASYDPEWATITYDWGISDGPDGTTISLDDETIAMPSFTPDLLGEYTFELIVNDGGQNSIADLVNIIVVPPPCLRISEIVEGDLYNKGIELWNCDDTDALDLRDYAVCMANQSNTLCNSYTLDLTGTLAAGGVLTICNDAASDANLTDNCDVFTGSQSTGVAAFNGDDRLLVYRNDGGEETFDPALDRRIDAFGQTNLAPASDTWADHTYRRCQPDAYDGTTAFDVYAYFNEFAQNDFDDFGIAPVDFTCTGPPNTGPTADAGLDQSGVIVDTQVSLDGTGSSDAETPSDELDYAWVFTVFPGAQAPTLTAPNTPLPTFTPTEAGTYTLELTVDDGDLDDTDTVTITVVAASGPCLIVSEYIEGQVQGTAGIEIYNCTGQSVDLTDVRICLVTDDAFQCTHVFDPSTTVSDLADGAVFGLCNSTLQQEADAGACSLSDDAVQHDGDDRWVVYIEKDASPGYSADDVLLDAFGNPDEPPAPGTWADVTFRRCDETPYLDVGIFDVNAFFGQYLPDDLSDFGVAPAEFTCVPNAAPTAVAGPNQPSFQLGGTVLLDGTASSDPDLGDTLNFNWTLDVPPGSVADLDDSSSATPSFTPDMLGDYTATLVVDDGRLQSAPDSAVITVVPAPTAPCLIISEYIHSDTLQGVELYNCSGGPLALDDLYVCVFKEGQECAGQRLIDLSVATSIPDGDTLGICDSVGLALEAPAGACTITRGTGALHDGDDQLLVFLDADGSNTYNAGDLDVDAFGDPGVVVEAGRWANSTYRRCDFAPYMPAETDTFIPLDYYNAGAVGDVHDFGTAPASVACEPGNGVPVADAGSDQPNIFLSGVGNSPTVVQLDGTGSSDADDSLTYSWTLEVPGGSRISLDGSTTATPILPPDVAGTYTATLIVNDGTVDSAPDSVVITVAAAPTCRLIFTEVMSDVAGSDDWEWVEVTNRGSGTCDLAGWVFDDINGLFHSGANIASGTVDSGDVAVLYNADAITAAEFEAAWAPGLNLIAVASWSQGILNDTGDGIALWESFTDYEVDTTREPSYDSDLPPIASHAFFDFSSVNGPEAVSYYLTDIRLGQPADTANWADSVNGVDLAFTSTAAGTNPGGEVGSPGVVVPAP